MKLHIRVVPNARKNQIAGWVNERLKVKICKPPEKGQANRELLNFLSEEWGLPKSCIDLVQGFTSRDKILKISSDKTMKLPPKPQKLI